MNTAFDADSLERGFAFLDGVPPALLPSIVTLPVGSLEDRARGIRRWRDALLAGRLPPTDTWPPDSVGAPIRRALEDMGLGRFCKDQPELVDALLRDILAGFARHNGTFQSEIADRLRELEALERRRQEEQEAELARREKRSARAPHPLESSLLRRLSQQAEREAAARDRPPDGELMTTWGERARLWAEIADVFGDLGEMLGRGWDLARGVLRQTGWLELQKLRALVEKLPQLRELVRALGRLQQSQNNTSVAEQILVPVRRLEEERREVRSPFIPAETRGIERSAEIGRMLPAEAAMLGHKKLRFLWHARRAERALLTYRVEGVEVERIQVEREVQKEIEAKRPRPERGPIIVVVDTSGSMQGVPEQVAKALVLETARTAHAEKRRCFLYNYGGPREVLEHELDLTPDGLGRLLAFLGSSFGGGTEPAGALSRVTARLKEQAWVKADVVVVSDGEWGASQALVASVQVARDAGTRFHGVQIGNLGRTGLHAICDPVHVFRDWAAAAGGRDRTRIGE